MLNTDNPLAGDLCDVFFFVFALHLRNLGGDEKQRMTFKNQQYFG